MAPNGSFRILLRLLLCSVAAFAVSASAQTNAGHGIAALVRSAAQDRALPTYRPFTPQPVDKATGILAPSASMFALDDAELNGLMEAAPSAFMLILPTRQGELRLRLVASKPLTDEFQVIAASTGRPVDVPNGSHYVGIVNEDPNTFAAISIFPGQVMGLVNDGHGDHVIGPMEGRREHIYYAAEDLRTHFNFACDTEEDPQGYTEDQANIEEGDRSVKCVRFYWEVNNDIYVAKGGMVNTVNYVTALFNQSAALYLNDGISVLLNQVYVWDVASPYTGTTMLEQLTYFQNTRNAFNGDLAHLIGLTGGGGRAASLAGLCNSDNDNSMCYSNVTTSFLNIPTYSWSVQVVTHEQGHLLGSNHTHACAWNGNNTQIDGCGPTAGYTEGNTCATGPIPPSGGTIMSYCHLNAVGVNFNNGFGPQPLAVILNSIGAAPCAITCTTAACGPVFIAPSSSITSTSAQLNWGPIANANSYKLQWKPVASGVWNTVSPILGTSYALSGLAPWTKYAFQVKTNCSVDSSAYSTIGGFTTAGSSLNDGLIACYPFNNSPNDASGNGHHGTLAGPLPTTDRYGVPNAAYAFDGVDDHIDITDLNTWAISNELSISFWVKAVESKGNLIVWAWPDISSDRLLVSPHYFHTGSNDFSWTFGAYNGSGSCYYTGYPLHQEWEHYVVTSSATSNSMKIYKNGALFDFEAHAGGITDLNRTLYIGGFYLPNFFLHGSLDDLAFHRRELTAGEVQQLYTTGTPCTQRLLVSPKVLLDGPYDQNTQLMTDALRAGNLLPTMEPYTGLGYILTSGGTSVAASFGVLAPSGANAICDWVLVDLRQPTAPYSVLATRTALVQRDGDVVGFDGVSPIPFDAGPGSYCIAVRHRNHLGVMTAAGVSLSSTTTTIDFTDPATATYGTNAQHNINGTMVIWPGDVNADGVVKYTGSLNDRDPILVAIGGSIATNTVTNVYSPLDVNMNGTISYTGISNDRDVILQTIGGSVASATRVEQLP